MKGFSWNRWDSPGRNPLRGGHRRRLVRLARQTDVVHHVAMKPSCTGLWRPGLPESVVINAFAGLGYAFMGTDAAVALVGKDVVESDGRF